MRKARNQLSILLLLASCILCLSVLGGFANAVELIVNPKNTQTIIRSDSGSYSPNRLKYKLRSSGGKVTWRIKSLPRWLRAKPAEGKVGSLRVNVKVRPKNSKISKLAPGIISGKIKLAYASKEKIVARNVKLIVEGNVSDGEIQFKKCRACHDSEDKNKIGPYMQGVYGRVAGTVPDFKYSDAMIAYGEIWEEGNLDRYLEDPRGFIPNTKMAYAGLDDPVDRMNVIAYLKSLTP